MSEPQSRREQDNDIQPRELQRLLVEAERALAGERAAREAAEAALRQTEKRWALLAENGNDLICRQDLDGVLKEVSPSSERLVGRAPGELVGQSIYDLIHPEDRQKVRALHQEAGLAGESGGVVCRLSCSGETLCEFEASARRAEDPETGEPELHTVWRDVSARSDLEQRLRLVQSAVEQASEAVVITESRLERPGPMILYVNPAFTRMTGYKAEEVVGKTPRILQGSRTSREVLDRLVAQLSRGEEFSGETYNYRKDGEEFILNWDIAPVRDAAGRITHWVSIQRDVTEQRLAEARARQHREELAHVTRLNTMGEMASGLAHELNQPLASIGVYAQSALRRVRQGEIDSKELQEAMAQVQVHAERAGEIIRRLRDFVRKRASRRGPQQINELVREVVALLEQDLRRGQTDLQLNLGEALPAVVVDPVQMEQVVLNLTRNAIEAMEANDANDRPLEIQTWAEAGEVRLVVNDAGKPLSDEAIQRLFEPFFTTKPQGLGVGLNISESIVEGHGGRLWVERRGGRGLAVHLSLPAKTTPARPG